MFGLSTQSSEYQRAVAERLHLPFELLSDHQLQLTDALKLPAFTVADRRLLKRTTLIAEADLVVKVFYPVFPPDKHAEVVVAWLRSGGSRSHA